MNADMTSTRAAVSLGLDFGTESVRAVLVDTHGNQRALVETSYEHGQILDTLPGRGERLPARYALQHPTDWIDAASAATRQAVARAGLSSDDVVGIGVDFTSCTMLPTTDDGTPLCLLQPYCDRPLAWPKLWKHHGAVEQTERMNQVARERDEPFLKRYGGTIGLEWLQPKMLETIELAPEIADATDVWIEAGDWFVWQLVGCSSESLTRSTCQAGYKALWSATDSYASPGFLEAVDPRLAEAVARKLPGVMRSPGESAGGLCADMASRFGLAARTPVSTAIIDAHAAVPGVGEAAAGTLVMVMGTSSCHMINAGTFQHVPGVAGIVEGGILPGLYGYETGQAAVGDAFAWLLRLVGRDRFDELAAEAASLPPGADGVLCIDWMAGCRTPLMDGRLRGAFAGLSLDHGPAHLYRALLEASGFGLRWIVELLREHGVPVNRFVATGGLPHHNPDSVAIYASVLGEPIEGHPAEQGPAIGAAVLGMVAAGPETTGFQTVEDAATAMAATREVDRVVVRPTDAATYDPIYTRYRTLAAALVELNKEIAPV